MTPSGKDINDSSAQLLRGVDTHEPTLCEHLTIDSRYPWNKRIIERTLLAEFAGKKDQNHMNWILGGNITHKIAF